LTGLVRPSAPETTRVQGDVIRDIRKLTKERVSKGMERKTEATPGPVTPQQCDKSPAVVAAKPQKVRSSRFEWEKDQSGPDRAVPAPHRRSLVRALKSWIARIFATDRSFFDNDDDASPSAA